MIMLIDHFNHSRHVVDITEEQVDTIFNCGLRSTDKFAKELYSRLLKAFDQPVLLLKLLMNSNLPLTPLLLFQSIHDCLYLKKPHEIARIIDEIVCKLGSLEATKLLNQTLELEKTTTPLSHKATFDQVRNFIALLD
jgi:hypothetical protein